MNCGIEFSVTHFSMNQTSGFVYIFNTLLAKVQISGSNVAKCSKIGVLIKDLQVTEFSKNPSFVFLLLKHFLCYFNVMVSKAVPLDAIDNVSVFAKQFLAGLFSRL